MKPTDRVDAGDTPKLIPPLADAAVELLRWAADRGEPQPRESGPREDQLLGYLRPRRIDSLYYLSSTPNAPPMQSGVAPSPWRAQRLYDLIWERQVDALRSFLEEADRQDVLAIVLKSSELLPRWYGSSGVEVGADVDVLVPQPHTERARAILMDRGYRHATFDTAAGAMVDVDKAVVERAEATHYELFPLSALVDIDLPDDLAPLVDGDAHGIYEVDGRWQLVVEVDLHHGLFRDTRADAVVERIVPSVHGAGWTLGSADHIWFTLTRLYNETAMHGNRSLRPVSYIIPEIAHGNVDWDVMREARAHVPIENALFYGLYFIEWLTPGSVPMDLLYEFHPCRNSRNGDWGWQLGKLFGFLEPFPFQLPSQ